MKAAVEKIKIFGSRIAEEASPVYRRDNQNAVSWRKRAGLYK